MIFELFLFGTLWFWGLLAAETVFLFYVIAHPRYGNLGLFSIVIILGALQLFGNIPVFSWISENTSTCLVIAAGFFPLAAIWAVIKWWLFVRDNSVRYDEVLLGFLESNKALYQNPNEFTTKQKVEWKEYFNRNSYSDSSYEYTKVEFNPSPRKHKSEIMTWMMLFPLSFIWTILNDPVRKICKHIYNSLVGQLIKIQNYYWADKVNHMPTDQEMHEYDNIRYNR